MHCSGDVVVKLCGRGGEESWKRDGLPQRRTELPEVNRPQARHHFIIRIEFGSKPGQLRRGKCAGEMVEPFDGPRPATADAATVIQVGNLQGRRSLYLAQEIESERIIFRGHKNGRANVYTQVTNAHHI